MQKLTAVGGAASIVAATVIGWYWASPFFAVANLRSAALRGDTNELNERVEFGRIREEVKTQVSRLLISQMTDDLRGNPLVALGVAIAANLTDVMVDTIISPVGIAGLVKTGDDRTPPEVSGLRLMLSPEVVVSRDGLSAFDFHLVTDREKQPTLRFGRDGLTWRLYSLKITSVR